MFGGLIALLDDVAALAKAAAASIDDVAAGALKASSKAVGVVVDDTAVTPQYVTGIQPARELPIIWRIAKGSLRNKLLFILPAILILSIFLPWVFTPILMIGGTYLSFEGAEKIWHKIFPPKDHPAHASHPEEAKTEGGAAEDRIVKGATTTDFILSCEVMVVAFNEVLDLPIIERLAIMIAVALIITAGVYGVVGILVKMDDAGLALSKSGKVGFAQAFGRGLVVAMPKVMRAITIIGTIAMLWVGGHLVIKGAADLGWGPIYAFGHHLGTYGELVPGVGGALAWLIDTIWSAIWGFIVGSIVVGIVMLVKKVRHRA